MQSNPINIYKIFNSLAGHWQLERRIPNQGLVKGQACFSNYKESSTLHYQETGILTLEDKKEFNFSREYFYYYENEQISVFFVENARPGKLFHTLEFSPRFKDADPIRACARHHCRHDIYDATYSFQDDKQFTVSYRVHGPTKNYSSATIFQR